MPKKLKKLTSTVSSKGQVTIPKQVRDRLGLVAGSEVEFEVDDGAVHVRKVPPSEGGIWKWVGYFERSGIDFPYKDSLEAVDDMRGRGR